MTEANASDLSMSATDSGLSAAGSVTQSGENVAGRDLATKSQTAGQIIENQTINYFRPDVDTGNRDRTVAIDVQELESVRQQGVELEAAFEDALKIREAMEDCARLIVLTDTPLEHFQQQLGYAVTLLDSVRDFYAEISIESSETGAVIPEVLQRLHDELAELYQLGQPPEVTSVRSVNGRLRDVRTQLNALAQVSYRHFKSCRMGIEKLLITMMLPPADGQVSRVENKPAPPSDSTNSSVNNIVNQTGGFG